MTLPAGSRAHLHHDRVEIVQVRQGGIDEPARDRHDFDRFFPKQPARHVEIVNHHVAKDLPEWPMYSRGGNPGSRLVMMTCRTSPISPSSIERRSCRALGSKRRSNATMTRPSSRSISWTAASTLAMSRSIGFSQSTAFPADGMKHQTDMSIGRRADDDGIDIGSLDRGDGIERGLTTEMTGQIAGCGAIWIGDRDQSYTGIRRRVVATSVGLPEVQVRQLGCQRLDRAGPPRASCPMGSHEPTLNASRAPGLMVCGKRRSRQRDGPESQRD